MVSVESLYTLALVYSLPISYESTSSRSEALLLYGSSQISDLQMLRCVRTFLSPSTMTILPPERLTMSGSCVNMARVLVFLATVCQIYVRQRV